MGGDCWVIKDQIGGKKISGGQKFSGGTFWGNAKKGVEKLFGGSKKWWEFFWGSQQFFGGEYFGEKKKSPGGFSGKFLNFRGDFLGGSYTGGRVWGGDCWEIKDQIGEKKISGGPEIFGGDFLGKCQKRGGKTFWWFQNVVGIFLGVTTIFWGRIFREKKKKSPWGFSGKFKKKNLGGIF